MSDTPRTQKPGEPNPKIDCECGCGSKIKKYDSQGRRRHFKPGHNPLPSPVWDAIKEALQAGPQPRNVLVRAAGATPEVVAFTLSKWKKRGAVTRVAHGMWALVEQ